jgi:hypothetical protein
MNLLIIKQAIQSMEMIFHINHAQILMGIENISNVQPFKPHSENQVYLAHSLALRISSHLVA